MTVLKKTLAAILGGFLMLPAPIAVANERHPIEDFVASYVETNMTEAAVPGMVFVHVDADGLISQSFGLADVETGRPMTSTTPLRVGSISKPITAAIALELAAAGTLDLDAPADAYLDVDLDDAYGSASTIRELLEHTGGYPDSFLGSHHVDTEEAVDLQEWIERVPRRSIANGVVASYSSVGYTVAGAAISGATGEAFADVADRTVFDPLGMTGATFVQPAPDDVATGYRWTDSGLTPFPIDATDLVPGAGLTASAEDVGAFMGGLVRRDTPFARSTLDGLLDPVGPAPGLRGFTIGLTEWHYGDRTVLYHEGNGIGTTSRMMILPDEGVGIYTAVNGAAMTGMGEPSTHSRFVRDLHRQLIERFYPTQAAHDATPDLRGRGVPTSAVSGTYVPTRVDTASMLRLEALVSQSEVSATSDGISFNGRPYFGGDDGFYRGASGDIRFLKGPDGVTYATMGGTGSFRQAAWWETATANAILAGGALLVMLLGLGTAVRRAPSRVRILMIGTTALAVGFIGVLGYGLSTIEIMDLFTGMPLILRLAQIAAIGLGVVAVIGPVAVLAQRAELTTRVLGSALAVSIAGIALTGWALMWRILPL